VKRYIMIVGLLLGLGFAISVESVRRNAEQTLDGEASAIVTVEWGGRVGLPLSLISMPLLERAHPLFASIPFPLTYVGLLLVVILNWFLLSIAIAYAASRWRTRDRPAANQR
jgi:hypothetical protein